MSPFKSQKAISVSIVQNSAACRAAFEILQREGRPEGVDFEIAQRKFRLRLAGGGYVT